MLLVVLQLLYLVLANALLNTDRLQARINQAPARFTLTWTSAWTAYPGHLRLHDLRVEVLTAQRHLALALDEVDTRIALWPLARRTLQLTRATAHGVEQARFDGYRMTGSGALRLAKLRWQQGRLSLERLALTLDAGTLAHDELTLTDDIQLDARFRLAPFTLAEHPGASAMEFVTGEMALTGRSDAYDVFNRYLAGIDWLTLEGHGQLEGHLDIVSGEFMPGSELRLTSPTLGVTLDEAHFAGDGERYRLSGAGTIRAAQMASRASRDEGESARQTHLSVTLDDMQMHQGERHRPLLKGNGFHLALTTSAVALAPAPLQLHGASLQWQDALVPDISLLNRYLPEPLPFDFSTGEARLRGELELVDTQLAGEFDITGSHVTVNLGDNPIIGTLGLHVAIPMLDMAARRLDLSGTRLELQAASSDDDPLPLATSLTLPVARFDAPDAMAEETLDANLDDTPPAWQVEVEIAGQVANLGWLDPFLTESFDGQGLSLEGGGRLQAALRLDRDLLLPGSRLEVRSEQLAGRFLDFRATGDGRLRIDIQQGEAHPEALLSLDVDDATLHRLSDDRRVFQARSLALFAQGDAPQLDRPLSRPRLIAEWQEAQLPDVAVLNAYLPGQAPLRLLAGSARSTGALSYRDHTLSGQLQLSGDAISAQLLEERLTGQLALELQIREADLANRQLDISGSRLSVQASSTDTEAPLRTLLLAPRARFSGGFDWSGPADSPSRAPSGILQLEGSLTHLGFINAFLPDEHGLKITGDGRLSAELTLDEGRLGEGSRLRILSSRLGARFLHYEALGDGSLTLEILGKGQRPFASLTLDLPSFGLRRRDSDGELIAGRLFTLHSQARRFDLEQGLQQLDTQIEMPYLVAPDLALFNAYLPEDAGIELLSGRAELATQLRLSGLSASGSLSLRSPDASLAIETQRLHGALSLDTQLTNGDLESMRFDLSGSSLRLDNVRLESEDGPRVHGWWAHLRIPRGEMTWQQPLALDAQLDLALRDSGLLVDLFVDAARQRQWLRQRLTVSDVYGAASVAIDESAIHLRDLAIRAEPLELLADLALQDRKLEGRLFARYGLLRLGVELEAGRRHWHWRRPRQWYERSQRAVNSQENREWIDSLDAISANLEELLAPND
ncbi:MULTISPECIES: hypothetical protein [Halomonadaceae]|nr:MULTISPECIES: hypothetical protein [Halomonas]